MKIKQMKGWQIKNAKEMMVQTCKIIVITIKGNGLNSLIIRHFHIEILFEISGLKLVKDPTHPRPAYVCRVRLLNLKNTISITGSQGFHF